MVAHRKALLRREARCISGATHSLRIEAEDARDMIESGKTGEDISASGGRISTQLWNKDLAPIPRDRRTWGTYNYAALWVAMSVNIPTYMLASAMIAGGMNWKQALVTVFLGNVIVLIPMLLNAHAGAQYGIPFPVFARSSFGVLGANVPAILRALVACGRVWISNLDRRRSDQHVARGGAARMGSPLALLLSFLVVESGGHSAWN